MCDGTVDKHTSYFCLTDTNGRGSALDKRRMISDLEIDQPVTICLEVISTPGLLLRPGTDKVCPGHSTQVYVNSSQQVAFWNVISYWSFIEAATCSILIMNFKVDSWWFKQLPFHLSEKIYISLTLHTDSNLPLSLNTVHKHKRPTQNMASWIPPPPINSYIYQKILR